MSGFGIREQWLAGKRLADPKKPLWRPASFLQQLSLNGSMLLVKNHDRHWQVGLAELMQERGRSWRSLSYRLRAMSGNKARKILWRASYQWWTNSSTAYPHLAHLAWRHGLERPEDLIAFDQRLKRTAAQLDALAWCETDSQREPISIVDIADMENKIQ